MEKGLVHKDFFRPSERMRKGMKPICEELGIRAFVTGFWSVSVTCFMDTPVENYTDVLRNDSAFFVEYRKRLIEKGRTCSR